MKNILTCSCLWMVAVLFLTSTSAWAIDCSGVPDWTAAGTYTNGSLVKANGIRYRAKWWTQNENPATHSGQWDVWENQGACDGGPPSNTPPAVTLTAPANGTSFPAGSTITLTANASDANGTVSKVEFFRGTTKLGEDLTSPYSFSWTNVAAGSYSLTAKATDNQAASTNSTAVSITVTTGGGGCTAPVYVSGSPYATGAEVQSGGNRYRCEVGGWCSTGGAYDPGTGWAWQNAWTLVGPCTSGNTPPTVSITSPVANFRFTPGQTVSIAATATDSDGSISKVEFYQGATRLGQDLTSPYTFSWTNVTAGTYNLTAVATDNQGAATTSAAVRITSETTPPPTGGLPRHAVIGFLHNFDNGSGIIRLRDVPAVYDVIILAFAEPVSPGSATMKFVPEISTKAELIADIQTMHSRGKKVLISIGGANAHLELNTTADRDAFKNSMIAIIQDYGLDGFDIDLEGGSVSLNPGDNSLANPTTPKIVNLIAATRAICNQFGPDFILTMAPETAYVQGGIGNYAGIFGSYLPIIHALRDKLTVLQVQHYNSGSMLGLDGRAYNQGTADFQVAMAETVLKGFNAGGNPSNPFPPLHEDQVAIGLPASTSAAGGGYTPPATVRQSLDYLLKGQSYGGAYVLRKPAGYPNIRGVMTWSINWDRVNGYTFGTSYDAYFNTLPARIGLSEASSSSLAVASVPNPFTDHTTIQFQTIRSEKVSLFIINQLGQKMADLSPGSVATGMHYVEWNSRELPKGMYVGLLTIGTHTQVFRLSKE